MVTRFTAFNKVTEEQGLFDKFFGLFDKMSSKQRNIMGETEGILNNVQNIMGNVFEQMNTTQFNSSLELYKGSETASSVKRLLDEVNTSNKTNDRKVTVKFMGTETQDEEEIKNIKRNIDKFDDYDLTFEYDADGFINKAIIERIS